MGAMRYEDLTVQDLSNLWIQWCQTNRTQRFGQFVINSMEDRAEIQDPSVFYADSDRAYNLLTKRIDMRKGL